MADDKPLDPADWVPPPTELTDVIAVYIGDVELDTGPARLTSSIRWDAKGMSWLTLDDPAVSDD